MKAVWKYPLTGWGTGAGFRHDLEMPFGSTVLTVQNQHGVSTLWAEVETEAPTVKRTFEWAGTGHAVPQGGVYVGTVQVQGGAFVFHLYEVPA